MKKVILLASVVCASISSFARDNAFLAKKGDKGIISKGFYLNLGLGFPSGKITSFDGFDASDAETQSFGFQPSLEIGNQWYFYNNDKIGVGLKVSWFQFGFSSAKLKDNDSIKVKTVDLKFLKVGPQFSMALNDDMALDFAIMASPSYMMQSYKSDSGIDRAPNFGLLIEPGVRFRYNKLAIGLDCAFGKSGGAYLADGADDSFVFKQSNLQPRLTVGFKF